MRGGIRISRGLLIHGGVGTIPSDAMTPSMASAYRDALSDALLAGHRAFEAGGSAIDAAVASVQVMEDSPLFNAGRGSNFDERGVVTMDASIMDGDSGNAGAVADVTDVRSPVELARLVMERSPHLFLAGEGAGAFARSQGIDPTPPDFFHTERRWTELLRAREEATDRPNVLGDDPIRSSGTVGAVARDETGRLAAATSTGGMANKTWGRVGDSPVIGAGTWASERCAVSCTGWGELFIRHAVAHDVHARMAYGGVDLAEAVRAVIFDTLDAHVPRSGGLIALGADGRAAFGFNTPGMYRGWIDVNGSPTVAIYSDD